MRICGVDDHVPKIERSIQTQKNENRSVCQAMPYRCIPCIMIRELVKQGNAFLNAFGSKDNIFDGLTPRNIINNLPHINYNDLKYEFGEYVQIHITEKVTNTMKSCTIGAIVLGPRNIQGQYNFMSLETGEQRNGRVVAKLPITQEVINRVEELGLNQGQPFRASKMLQYEWCLGRPIADDDFALDQEVERPGIIPAPIQQIIPPAGPIPFAINNTANQGADGNNDQQRNVQDAEHTGEDQGVAQGEDQGALKERIRQIATMTTIPKTVTMTMTTILKEKKNGVEEGSILKPLKGRNTEGENARKSQGLSLSFRPSLKI